MPVLRERENGYFKGLIPASFSLFLSFQQLTVSACTILHFANDWI